MSKRRERRWRQILGRMHPIASLDFPKHTWNCNLWSHSTTLSTKPIPLWLSFTRSISFLDYVNLYLFIYYSSSSKLTIINKANHYYKYSFFPSFPQFFLFFLWNRYKYVLYSSNVNFFMDDIHRSTCVSVKRVW